MMYTNFPLYFKDVSTGMAQLTVDIVFVNSRKHFRSTNNSKLPFLVMSGM